MSDQETLVYGQFYHLYSHEVGNRDLFFEPGNYEYFLSLWDKHIFPIADMFDWAQMKNYFHALVRIKEEKDITAAAPLNLTGFENLSGYMTCISIKPTRLHWEAVIRRFDSEANFKTMHNGKLDIGGIEEWLGMG